MITKEKLENGYILNDKGELLQKFVDAAEFHGFDTDWMDGKIGELISEYIFIDEKDTVDGGSSVHLHPLKKELTLEDFNEATKNDTDSVSKWKYTPIEIESIFDWKEALESGNLYHEDGDDVGKIGSEWKLINILVEDKCQVYFREEIKWQDEVLDYLRNTTDKISIFSMESWVIRDVIKDNPEDFLEAARIALRSTGELK